jgi:non-ribosomal peptide synthetase component F
LPLQYADFAAWQRQWRSHPDLAAQLSYWREQLRDPLPPMTLAKGSAKRSADDLRTQSRDVEVPAEIVEAVRTLSQREGGTLFMGLVSALQMLMHHYLDETDLRVATNVANRNQSGTERLIGPLANTVILRTDLGGDPSPRDVLRRVRAATLAAYAHQDIPFEELAEAISNKRGLDPMQLSRVMILLHNAALRPVASSGQSLVFEEADPAMPMPLVTTTTYDVILVLREFEDGLRGSCIYKPRLFSAGFIDRLLGHYQKMLEQMATRPDRPMSSGRIAVPRKVKVG